MAEGRAENVDRAAWNHTAAIVSTIMNVLRGKGQKSVTPESLNPYHKGKDKSMDRETMARSLDLPYVKGKVKPSQPTLST